MIDIEGLQVRFADAAAPALRCPRLRAAEGEMILVCGPTGSGKSTLLGTLIGLVPHFTGGTLTGRVRVAGRDTRQNRPRDLAGVVGYVHQHPAASFVSDHVEDEIAYGLETLGLAPTVMRRRVEETLDLMDLADLRSRPLRRLSGGQQQRVAIAAVLASGPELLVLDEPTSALDPVAAEEVLSALQRLVHDHGLTVVLAEHRLERVVHHADGIVLVEDGLASDVLAPAAAMAASPVYPPLVALGRYAGWDPLPLSVRAARRAAVDLRAELDAPALDVPSNGARAEMRSRAPDPAPDPAPGTPPALHRDPVLRMRGLVVVRGSRRVLAGIDLAVAPGEIVAVMGRNGAGKSTLLWACAGALTAAAGRIDVRGRSVAEYSPPTASPPSGWCRRIRRTCCTRRASARSAGTRTRMRGRRRGAAPRCSPTWPGAWIPRSTRATCRRGSAWRSPSQWCCSAAPAYCSSTSRPAVLTTRRRRTWWGCCGGSLRQVPRS